MKYIGTKRLETNRLILRKLTLEDADEAFNNWCNDYDVTKYVLWGKHNSVDDTKRLYEAWVKEYEEIDTFRWIVEIKETHELIGTIDVASKKLITSGTCEIGYCYGKKFWHKGYGVEALKAVIKYLFEECDAHIIFAEHLSNNPHSGDVMRKSGMSYEGVQRERVIDKDGFRNDLISYSITKEEYFK